MSTPDRYVSLYREFAKLSPVMHDDQGNIEPGINIGGALTRSTAAQLTSLSTAVTVNASKGAITLFSAVGAGAGDSFTVNNSLVTTSSIILLNSASITGTAAGTRDTFTVALQAAPAAGSFVVHVYNNDAAPTDTFLPIVYFAIL